MSENTDISAPSAGSTIETLINFLVEHGSDLSDSQLKSVKGRIKTQATRTAYVAGMDVDNVIKEGTREGKKAATAEIRKFQTDRPDPKVDPSAYTRWLETSATAGI